LYIPISWSTSTHSCGLSCHPEWLHVIADGYITVAHTPASLRVIRNGYMSSAMVTLLSPIYPRACVSSAMVTSLPPILLCRCRLHSLTFGVSHRLQRTSPRSTNSKRHRDNFLFFYSNIKPFFSSFSRLFCCAFAGHSGIARAVGLARVSVILEGHSRMARFYCPLNLYGPLPAMDQNIVWPATRYGPEHNKDNILLSRKNACTPDMITNANLTREYTAGGAKPGWPTACAAAYSLFKMRRDCCPKLPPGIHSHQWFFAHRQLWIKHCRLEL
jgi:hypothetical protein